MSASHTPGPWEVGEEVFSLIVYKPDGYFVATTNVLGGFNSASRVEQAKADARLISAAPELLEALKNLLIAHDCGADETGYVTDVGFMDIDAIAEQARAAIAKAEGGQP